MKLQDREIIRIVYDDKDFGEQIITESRRNNTDSDYISSDSRGVNEFTAKKGYVASLAELFTLINKSYRLS